MKLTKWLVLGAFTCLTATAASAAMDAYMVIGSGPKVPIQNVSFGSSQRSASVGTTDARAGKSQMGEIVITKKLDQSSPKLMRAKATGKSLQHVTILFKSSNHPNKRAAEKIELSDVMISSYQRSADSETMTLNYEKIQVTTPSGIKTTRDEWDLPAMN